MDFGTTIAIVVTSIAGTSMFVALINAILRHRQEMRRMELESRPVQQQDTTGLTRDFQTLREGITAHAMSLDDNLKNLSSRMTSMENRLSEVEGQQKVSS